MKREYEGTEWVAFTLTMPNVGSWNGKWTGAGNLYCIVREVPHDYIDKIIGDEDEANYLYSWDDGWSANINVKVINSHQADELREKSKGFYGYEWMVDSIVLYQEILTETERKQRAVNQ